MLPAEVLDIQKGDFVLDLCAAPGGKSTHLLSIFRDCPGAMLVSNEVIRARATVLAENIAKWGAANVVVSNNDPADFGAFAGFFDKVVVDDNSDQMLDKILLKEAISKSIKEKSSNLVGNMASQGTTPRQLTDLIGSLCDLTSGSGDKGTPVIHIQGYFDNYTNE